MTIREQPPGFDNPFLHRPWMTVSGAAAPGDQPPSTHKKRKGWRRVLAGGLAGSVEIGITYPTEYVKTNLQLDVDGKKRYEGVIDCVRKTIKKEGFQGFYRGLSPLLLGAMPKATTRFAWFETCKSCLADEKGNLRPVDRAICGLGAGVAEAIVAVTPMETVKIKFIHDMRMPEPKYKGLIDGVSTIVKEEGVKGLYQGVTATILKQGTNQAIRFFVMESLKYWYNGGDNSVSVPKHVIGTFGAVAGAASVFGNTPLDVVKTRMQSLDGGRYRNTLDCIDQILRHEGVGAFYKGTVPRLARVCLDVAITFVLFESFLDLLRKRSDRDKSK